MTEPKLLTRAELEALVLVRLYEYEPGRTLRYVRESDIPEPYRTEFGTSLRGSTIPEVPGEEPRGCVFAHDWLVWLAGYTPGWPEHGKRRP